MFNFQSSQNVIPFKENPVCLNQNLNKVVTLRLAGMLMFAFDTVFCTLNLLNWLL